MVNLFVNLTTKESFSSSVEQSTGTEPFGAIEKAMLLYREVKVGEADALDEKNPIICSIGQSVNMKPPLGGRVTVMAKTPLNGKVTLANSGGFFGVQMFQNHISSLVIGGKANAPVYLFIKGGLVHIRSAVHLWGKNIEESINQLQKETSTHCCMFVIGRAGEEMSSIGVVMTEKRRSLGREGLGAVFGSKNVKAIVISSEENRVPYALQPDSCLSCGIGCVQMKNKKNEHDMVYQLLDDYGFDRFGIQHIISYLVSADGRKVVEPYVSKGMSLDFDDFENVKKWLEILCSHNDFVELAKTQNDKKVDVEIQPMKFLIDTMGLCNQIYKKVDHIDEAVKLINRLCNTNYTEVDINDAIERVRKLLVQINKG